MQSEITTRCIACGVVLRSEFAGAQCSTCLLRLATTDSEVDRLEPLLQSGVLPRFDDYEIEAEIASGGMGVVYRATQLSLKRPVAIKTIIGGHLASPESIARFRSEAEAAARLDHPGIIPIYEVGEHQTQQFLSMKLIEGGSLEDRISEFALSPDLSGTEAQERQIQIATLMLAIADATEHAHERGVLHRDIKPSNVLIDNTGQPYLTDFGLAKLLGDEASAQTVAGGVIGSPSYMPPEQATCKVDEITIAADVYGLGATLYRLLTDQPPFTGPTPMATVRSVVDDAPTPPRTINPRISRDLETITLKCLQKKPNARYRSAAELTDELRKFIEGRPIEARPVSTMEHVWRWSRRNPVFAGLLASLFVVTTVGLTATTWKWKEAVFERKQADAERDNAERQSYFAQMQVVSASLELKQPQRAAQALELTPTHLRGWEYGYFSARVNQSRGPFGRFDQGSWLVRFTSSGRCIFLQDHQKTLGAMHDMLTGKEEHQHVLINPTGTHFAMPHDSGTKIVSELGQSSNVIETPFERVLAIGDEGKRVVISSSDMVQIIDARSDRIQCSIEMKPHRVHRSVLRGNRLLTATIRSAPKGTILTLWNASTGERIGEVENASRYLFSEDGKDVVFGTMEPDNELKIWDVNSGDARTFENRVNEKVIEMAISPDARFLATAEFDDVVLHDLHEQTIVARLEDHTDLVHSLRFSRDGAKLASGSDDRTIRIWDAKTGKPLRTLTGATQPLRSLSFSPDDRWLASSGWETGFRLWNLDTPPDSLRLGGMLSYVAAHPDGDRIVVTSSDGTVRIFSNSTQSLDTVFTCEDGGILRAAFSPDGKLLAFQVEYFRDTAECNALYIWDFENNQLLHNITVPRVVQYCNVAFSPDSSLLAAGSQDGIVRIWRPRTGDLVASLGEPGAVNRHVSFSPNGKHLSSIYHDEVRVWDIARRDLVGSLRGHDHFIYDAKFSPDGKLIASASHDHTVRLWDTGELSQIAVLPLSNHALCLSFTPDGTRLAVGDRDTGVHLWDVQHARPVATLYGHEGSVNGVAFSPDGTRLYTASSDGTARVWDTTRASLD